MTAQAKVILQWQPRSDRLRAEGVEVSSAKQHVRRFITSGNIRPVSDDELDELSSREILGMSQEITALAERAYA